MEIKHIEGEDKVFFGERKSDKERIYISIPKWDCKWYWSFGYLGNKNEHYHLDGYQRKDHFLTLQDGSYKLITEKRNINMHDALLEDYELNQSIKNNLWEFCELARTIYTLKETAEIYYRGGSHYTKNPCKETLKSKEKYKDLVCNVLPELLQAFWDLTGGNE